MSNENHNNEPGYHYFSVSCLYFNVGMKIHELISKQKRKDRNKRSSYKASSYAVYRVPLALSSTYSITNFTPDVDGVELVLKEDY